MTCHDIAWEEYLKSLKVCDSDDKTASDEMDNKWTLDMMEAEAGKYFNTIQLIAKII